MATQKAFSTGSEFPALSPGTLRLYSMRYCPYAQRARIVLKHKNIPHEIVNINLKDKPEWYLKLNPLGKVPTIQKDDVVVYESMVVCEYLDAVYPGNKIVPSDPYQRAKDSMFLERYSKVIYGYYGLRKNEEPEAIQAAAASLLSDLKLVEEELEARNTTFFGGDKPMLLDFACWPHMEKLTAVATVLPAVTISAEAFPRLSAWIRDISAVPAVRDTNTPAEELMAFVDTVRAGKANYDYGLEE